MLHVSLSVLNVQELRRALELARSRNQSSLADDIVAELEARQSPRPTEPICFEAAEPDPEPDTPEGGHWANLAEGRCYVRDAPALPDGGYRLTRPHLLRP